MTFVKHCIRDQQCPQATTGTFSLSHQQSCNQSASLFLLFSFSPLLFISLCAVQPVRSLACLIWVNDARTRPGLRLQQECRRNSCGQAEHITFTFMHLHCIQVTVSTFFLSALAFPGNRTHDLGVASAMLYQLSYRKSISLIFLLHSFSPLILTMCAYNSTA